MLLFRFQSADMLYGSMMPHDCVTRTAAVLKSFHLSSFQSIALTYRRLPLFNSEGSDFFQSCSGHDLHVFIVEYIYSFGHVPVGTLL